FTVASTKRSPRGASGNDSFAMYRHSTCIRGRGSEQERRGETRESVATSIPPNDLEYSICLSAFSRISTTAPTHSWGSETGDVGRVKRGAGALQGCNRRCLVGRTRGVLQGADGKSLPATARRACRNRVRLVDRRSAGQHCGCAKGVASRKTGNGCAHAPL